MTQRITITAHIQEMMGMGIPDRRYQVVLEWQQGGHVLVDDDDGRGYPLYKAEQLFAILQKTCVGEYEIPTKVVRCDGVKA